jgi:hypothetical protein
MFAVREHRRKQEAALRPCSSAGYDTDTFVQAGEPNPCARPANCSFGSIAELYLQFKSLFLALESPLLSGCGHRVYFFDHHFFHMAAVVTAEQVRLFMPDEKDEIQATLKGFGKYILLHGGSRARNLPSARITMLEPDEVWEGNPKATTAKWVYIKQFDSKPYPYTVALLTERPEQGNIIVPVSSFPCRKTDLKRWRQGRQIYQRQIQPPRGG